LRHRCNNQAGIPLSPWSGHQPRRIDLKKSAAADFSAHPNPSAPNKSIAMGVVMAWDNSLPGGETNMMRLGFEFPRYNTLAMEALGLGAVILAMMGTLAWEPNGLRNDQWPPNTQTADGWHIPIDEKQDTVAPGSNIMVTGGSLDSLALKPVPRLTPSPFVTPADTAADHSSSGFAETYLRVAARAHADNTPVEVFPPAVHAPYEIEAIKTEVAFVDEVSAPREPLPASTDDVADLLAASKGKPRVFVHYSRQLAFGADMAATAADALQQQDHQIADIRVVPYAVSHPRVRYFFANDREAAEKVAEDVARSVIGEAAASPDVTVQDFSHFRPRPTPGNIEVWLPSDRTLFATVDVASR
jgi:hypothetical protein